MRKLAAAAAVATVPASFLVWLEVDYRLPLTIGALAGFLAGMGAVLAVDAVARRRRRRRSRSRGDA